MPVYKIGDLVMPKACYDLDEENPEALGLIVEMRSMMHLKPEAKVLWNDMLDVGPKWMFIDGIQPL